MWVHVETVGYAQELEDLRAVALGREVLVRGVGTSTLGERVGDRGVTVDVSTSDSTTDEKNTTIFEHLDTWKPSSRGQHVDLCGRSTW